MTTHTTARAALLALAVSVAAPAAAQTPVTLTFEGVATSAQGFAATVPDQSGFVFESFGVYAASNVLGTGANASSGTRFAYGYAGAGGSSFVYQAADLSFSFVSAALSFRTFDGNVSPASITVNGYRANAAAPAFSRTLSLTNTAQLFAFGWGDVYELEFVTTALDADRSAVLAVDDLTLSTIPEPGSVALLATGLGAIALVGARRRTRR